MPTRQEIENADTTMLVVLCQQLAEKPTTHKVTIDEALHLKHEWAMLMARGTPPPSDYKANEQLKQEEATLRKRMVDFLAAQL